MDSHAKLATQYLKDKKKALWFDESIWFVRKKRDIQKEDLSEWEQLRTLASQIKEHTLANLGDYLLQFEENALKNGVQVHWASTADEHNRIMEKILKDNNIHRIVKSKSMLTEECGMNEYLHEKGFDVVDTDLGERIVQLAHEKPCHIVMPALHKSKEEIGELFLKAKISDIYSNDATYLTGRARIHLREKFIASEAALSGVNFAVAETGSIVVCTNEGNADLGINAAKVHIASMGIEKIIPSLQHLGIFTRLLARSATGQLLTTYTSHFSKPEVGKQIHIIIVDNNRSKILAEKDFFTSLKCIRCGACMNTCPVYRRSGGHSYSFTIPGPIGVVLAPHHNMNKYSSLPGASTLCGSCDNVCPVKINLSEQIYLWRQKLTGAGKQSVMKSLIMKIFGVVLASPGLYKFVFGNIRFLIRHFRKPITRNSLNPWGKTRELPPTPKQSFKDWFKEKEA
jgi:L-lactate dehydrogenase complex protein LldF